MHSSTVEHELINAFKAYISVYMLERDQKKTLRWLGKEMSGFGTGLDERGFSREDSIALFRRDLEQIPNPFRLNQHFIHVQVLSETIGLVMAEMDLEVEINQTPFRLEHIRFSLVFRKLDNKWFLVHNHISGPLTGQSPGEAYPLRELQERNRTLEILVAEKTRELQHALGKMEELATTDKLTGITNRTRFDNLIEDAVDLNKNNLRPTSLILLDVDHFKEINDSYGHLIGDDVLREISQTLQETIRKVDLLGRWGGEEFIILLPETDLASALKCAEKIRRGIETRDFQLGQSVTASLGVAEYHHGESVDDWVKRTDDALYSAKRQHRNRVEAG